MPLAVKYASLVRFLSDPDNPELHSRIDKDSDFHNIIEIRANAYRSCVDFEHDSHLWRAIHWTSMEGHPGKSL